MKTSSRKAKGRNLQKEVAKRLQEIFSLEDDDCISKPMGSPGEDIILSPKARKLFPYSIECKNVKSFSGFRFYDQAESNARKNIPIVVVGQNRDKRRLVLVELEHFLDVCKNYTCS